jgi:hypothetical protein
MRRSDFYIKLIAVLLFVAIASYLGIYLYTSARNPFQTALAVGYTVERTGAADGFVVRDEKVIPGGGGAVARSVGDGEKVAAGETVATVYYGQDALERAGEIRTLRLKIDRLEEDIHGGPGGAASARDLNSVTELAAAIALRDLANLDALAFEIETGLFGAFAVSADELAALKARLRELESAAGNALEITAMSAGIYYSEADGFEGVGPTDLSELIPSALGKMFDTGKASGERGVGKLIYGITWYYAAVMDTRDAAELTVGRKIEVRFLRPFKLSVTMKVESVGAAEDGHLVVVFSSRERLRDTLPLRGAVAETVTGSYSGIRVPKEAINLDEENRTFIYLLTGGRAEKVYVTILTEFGDSYIVEDGAVSDTVLREGAVIIVKANDLFDGKVVGR